MKTLEQILDIDNRVIRWPKDKHQRTLILSYIYTKFEPHRIYHEREVNEVLKQWHTFQDWALLRRELIDRQYLTRNTDGTEYRTLPRT